MSDTIREPIQQRSIDKKNRIINAGYKLFAKNGYFDTNTVEIAKKAGVSTGIVYGYFRDKRDILLEVLDIYCDNVFLPIFDMFGNIQAPIDFGKIIPHIIDMAVLIHQKNAGIHQALHSLSTTDKAVSEKFLGLEEKLTFYIFENLQKNGYSPENLKEQIHLSFEIIQSYAHERIFDNHPYLDYDKMNKIILNMILKLFLY